MNKTVKKTVKKIKKQKKSVDLVTTHANAAGIDIGSRSHFVAVPEGRCEYNVKEFSAFTSGLEEVCAWLKKCKIKTVAMESTGVYWIPLYEMLEEKGFEVYLVDARTIKNVPGRKTDVLDCQWIQRLHSYGLLSRAFRPEDKVAKLRSYVRQRNRLTKDASRYILRMNKALTEMNLCLPNVIRDITGATGIQIIKSIIAGEYRPEILAKHRDPRCKNSEETIIESLKGNYREEHLFALQQSYEMYEFYNIKIGECEKRIEEYSKTFEDKADEDEIELKKVNKPKAHKKSYAFRVENELIRLTGVNLLAIPGINEAGAMQIISEIGLDMSRWKSAKHFSSWLGLCPGSKISGGKVISSKSKKCGNRAAQALRMAANALRNSKTYLGAFFRRLNARLGPCKAITALANKLARIIYNMLKHGEEFREQGEDYFELRYRKRVEKNLERRAKELGFTLVQIESKVASPTV